MKKNAICLFVLITTFLIGLGFYSYSPIGIAEAKVLDLMNELHQAEQNKDEEKLNQILADNFSRTHNRETRPKTKAELINYVNKFDFEIESTEAFFVSTEIESERVRIYFLMVQKFISENGKPITHTGDYTYTFEKRQNEWKLASIHLEN